jgi:N-acetylglucosaminyldiphosphoundecaprenol N-acetyl-beta-D-mannosaminyltransferase
MPHLTDNAPLARPTASVGAVQFDALTRWDAANHVRDELVRGRGGRVVVVTNEQLWQRDDVPALDDADLVLAGSTTAVWASRLAGTPLPERVTAAGLADAVCAACNADGRRVFFVGGAAGRSGIPSAAQRAAAVVSVRHQGLRVAGCAELAAAVATDPQALATVLAEIIEAKPDVILVGADHAAAEETLVRAVRAELNSGWLFSSTGLVRELAGDPGSRTRGRRVHVSSGARLLGRSATVRFTSRRRSGS